MCLIPGVFVFVLSVVGRLVGDANPPVMGRFFKVIVLLFLRMLGCLLGAFYPPLGRAFLRLFEY
mgnify:FL=1